MQATLNQVIRVNLCRDRLGAPIPTADRADALLVLRDHADAIGATIDMRDMFFPKLAVNYGIAEHRELAEKLRRVHTLRVVA
jgi:hypothetical protein